MPISERKKEIRRRRKRRTNYTDMKAKLPNADAVLREKICQKLRRMTPGADQLIKDWEIG